MNAATNSTVSKNKATFDALKGDFGYVNMMQAPKLVKIVVSGEI